MSAGTGQTRMMFNQLDTALISMAQEQRQLASSERMDSQRLNLIEILLVQLQIDVLASNKSQRGEVSNNV